MASLYAKYLAEHRGDQIIESEHGFATYRFFDTPTGQAVYIIDIFIEKDFRKAGLAAKLADIIVEAAKQRGCVKLLGTVAPAANNATDSLKILLAYGMSVVGLQDGLILFEKLI